MKIRTGPSYARSGFALILVMLTVIALTTLVASFVISMNTEVRLARNTDYDEKLEWMGRSGVEEARFLLANKSPEQRNIDALNQYWAGGPNKGSNDLSNIVPLDNESMGEGTRSLKITDMERKWDINLVAGANGAPPQKDVLQKALQVVGITDTGLASTIEDSLTDWCRGNNSVASFSGAGGDYYMHLNPPYYCKSGQIDDLSELLLIKGITPEIYWGSNSTNHPVSAYQQHGGGGFAQPISRTGMSANNDEPVYPVGLEQLFSPLGNRLNINTASALTLQLIPGMDEQTAARIIQQRAGPDGIDGTDDDMPFMSPGEISGGMPGGGPAPPNVPGAPPIGVAAQGMANYIGVRSDVFEVKVEAEINGYKRSFYGIVSRVGQGGPQLKCVKFYWK